MDIRDKIITGTFAIGHDGRKEPINWKDYAIKLEQYIAASYKGGEDAQTFEQILESYHVTLEDNRRDESFKLAAEKYASQFASNKGGKDGFWTNEMILRYAELYRWSSGRITMKGFLEDTDGWQKVGIIEAKQFQEETDKLLQSVPPYKEEEKVDHWKIEQFNRVKDNFVLAEKKTINWAIAAVDVLKTMLAKHKLDMGVQSANALIKNLQELLKDKSFTEDDEGRNINKNESAPLLSALIDIMNADPKDAKGIADRALSSHNPLADEDEEGLEQLIKKIKAEGGSIVSSNQCTEMEIAFAAACDRMWVDPETSFGFIYRPNHPYKEEVDKELRDGYYCGIYNHLPVVVDVQNKQIHSITFAEGKVRYMSIEPFEENEREWLQLLESKEEAGEENHTTKK